MGGYRLPERTALLDFSQSDYAGAEVRVTLKVKIGTFRELMAARDQVAGGGDEASLDQAVGLLCEIVREWNLEDEDGPIPTTREGFDRIDDLGFLLAIIDGWGAALQGVTEVSADLKAGSSNGVTSTSVTPSSSR